jgi:predicted metal-dependent hydrolase
MTQFELPFRDRPVSAVPRPLRVAGRIHLVRFVRVRRARRYVLRVGADGTLRVSVPPFGSIVEAQRFVRRQAQWIARERARVLLLLQGPVEDTREDQAAAARDLPPRLRELAARHGFDVGSVRVGDQRTLWGSCSRRGSISLNWRLIRMPAEVRDYILLHELAHLRHPDHSRRFWALVASICPWYRDAHRWLRQNT